MSNNPSNLDLIQSNQAQKEAVANALFTAASPAMIYGRREFTSAGLVWGYYGGKLKTGSGYLDIANGTVTLTASATNYIEADLSTGAVSTNTSGWTGAGYLALYQVTVDASVATAWQDFRQALLSGAGDGSLAFTDLTDAPHSYTGQAGKFTAVKSDETGLEFVDAPTGVEDFTDLGDVPSSYTGQAGKLVKVKTDETGLEFATDPGGVTDFVDLDDVPSSYTGQAGKITAVKGDESGLEFIDAPTGGVDEFTELTDVPSTYTGQGGKFAAVKVDESGLEFVDAPSGAGDFIDLGDVPSSYTGQAGKITAVKGDETGLEFIDAPTSGVDTFIELTDAPSSYTGEGGKVVKVRVDETGLEFDEEINEFTELTDVPSSYTGQGGKLVKVKVDESGLEFTTDPGGVTDFTDLGDVPSSYTGQAGKIAAVKGDETGLQFVDMPAGLEDYSLWARRSATTSGLDWGYYGGAFVLFNGTQTIISAGVVTLADNATNYIQLQRSTGALTSNTTGFDFYSRIPIAEVTTSGGVQTGYIDWRQKIDNAQATYFGLYQSQLDLGINHCQDVIAVKNGNDRKIMQLRDGYFEYNYGTWQAYDLLHNESIESSFPETAVTLAGGKVRLTDGSVTDYAEERFVLGADEVTLIWANRATGVVTADDTVSVFPAGSLPLYTITTVAGNFSDLVSHRSVDLADKPLDTITATFDGAGAPIAVNSFTDVVVPYACTIKSATLLADVTGSIEIDVWVDTYANFPPTSGDSIVGANPPDITAGIKSQDTTLSGWTVDVAAGSIVRFSVNSATTITRATLALTVQRK